jgi:hypothetical protein
VTSIALAVFIECFVADPTTVDLFAERDLVCEYIAYDRWLCCSTRVPEEAEKR